MQLNTVEKTKQLHPGMMHSKVVQLLGQPKTVQFIGDKVILKYSLHENWKGWVPYYMVFTKGTGRLESWYADEAEYQRNQQAWMQAFQAFQASSSTGQSSGIRSTGEGGAGYMEGYDPNANYYTDDSYLSGSGYHYDD